MADIEIRREHALGLAGARKAADEMATHLGRKFGLQGDWAGNTLHFDRPGVNGSLAVTATGIHLSVTLGFLLKAMRAPIERAVHEELDALFARKAAPAKATAKPAPAKKAPAPRKKGG